MTVRHAHEAGGAMPIPPLRNHIVLVSGQAVPTLLGASMPGCEPVCIHAVVTPTMKGAARLLRQALDGRGRQCTFKEYALADSSDQNSIYDVLETIRAACGGETLGVNLTGGTKLMALATAEWAHVCAIPAFYIDTEGEQVISVGSNWGYAPLPDVLTVPGLLTANGFEVEEANPDPVPARRRDILTSLLRLGCTSAGEGALTRLNRLALAAKGSLYARDDGPEEAPWCDLLDLCQQAGTVEADSGYVAFPDEAGRKWCNGVWFEEYVRMTLFRLKLAQRIRDFASSVSVRRDGVRNELDALFTVRNRLFAIECKTSFMEGRSSEQQNRAASALYKLDSLHDRLGGIMTRAMLCSVHPLRPEDRERAQTMKLRVVCGRALLNLEQELVTWSNKA